MSGLQTVHPEFRPQACNLARLHALVVQRVPPGTREETCEKYEHRFVLSLMLNAHRCGAQKQDGLAPSRELFAVPRLQRLPDWRRPCRAAQNLATQCLCSTAQNSTRQCLCITLLHRALLCLCRTATSLTTHCLCVTLPNGALALRHIALPRFVLPLHSLIWHSRGYSSCVSLRS